MSTNVKDPNKIIDTLVKSLTEINAFLPAAAPGIAAIVGLFKSGLKTGKSLEEIAAEAADTDATTGRTKAKSEQQMGNQP